MGRIGEVRGSQELNVHDETASDLRQFMFADMPDNMAELYTELKKRRIVVEVAETRDTWVVKGPLFSEAVNKELAKRRPIYRQRRRGVATFGLAFSGLAMLSLLILPEPLNWIMAVGCLIPFVVPLFKYKMAKRRVRRT